MPAGPPDRVSAARLASARPALGRGGADRVPGQPSSTRAPRRAAAARWAVTEGAGYSRQRHGRAARSIAPSTAGRSPEGDSPETSSAQGHATSRARPRPGKPEWISRVRRTARLAPPMDKALYVREMLRRSLPATTRANRFSLTAGVDEAWRKRAVVELAAPRGGTSADLCLRHRRPRFPPAARRIRRCGVTGVDFTAPMLERRPGARRAGTDRTARASFRRGPTVTRLPFDDARFTARRGFLVRNWSTSAHAHRSRAAILRTGGAVRQPRRDAGRRPARPGVRSASTSTASCRWSAVWSRLENGLPLLARTR